MTAFVITATLLVVATLAWVLRPLWRARPLVGAGFGAGLAALCALLYVVVGTPAALDPAQHRPPATLAEAITQLRVELDRDPNQPEGWRLLARSYAAEGRRAEARDAFARALALLPDDADAMVETAEARALAAPGNRFDAAAVTLLRDALAVQPAHQRARWFLGIAQRQSGDPAAAARTWEPLLAVVDTKAAAPLRTQIDAARKDAGLPPLPPQVAAAPDANGAGATAAAGEAAPASANALRVQVALDPDFAARVRLRGDASVFVIARVPNGPPMPVAVEKHPVSALPLTVTLDDGDSPMPTQKLSALKEVEVFARLSTSGNAMRQDGDIESKPVRVTLPANRDIELKIGAKP